jgi:glycosyltransferase involved in cell wall biosynthesis
VKPCVIFIGNFLSQHGYTRQFIEDLADHLEYKGWIIIRTSNLLPRFLRLFDMVFTILANRKKYSIGHIVVFSGAAFIWAELTCWMLKLLKKPIILSLHGGNLPQFSCRWPGRVRHLLNSAIYVITPSLYLFEEMSKYRSDLILIPNPLDLHSYNHRPRQNPFPELIWLRSFHEIYNPSLAIEVVSRLVYDWPDIHLTMIGPDKGDGSFQRAQETAKRLGIEKHILFPGLVAKSDVSNWLQKGDIFINTTNVDNTPISILEAMASGLCIVSTNVGGIPYLLQDDDDALLVPANDPQSMAKAIKRLLNETELFIRLSQNARDKVEQFDWSRILPKWETLFLEVING